MTNQNDENIRATVNLSNTVYNRLDVQKLKKRNHDND